MPVFNIISAGENSKSLLLRMRLRAQTLQPGTVMERSRNQIRNSPMEGFQSALCFNTALIGRWRFDADAASLCNFPIMFFFFFAFRLDGVEACWVPLTVVPITILASEPFMTSKAIGPAHESHPLLQKQHANFWRSFVVRFNQPGESQQ